MTNGAAMVDQIKITKEETGSGGRYVAVVSGHEAEMAFSRASPHLIIIDHTAVPDALRGQGVGQALALHAVEDARAGVGKSFRCVRSCAPNRFGMRSGLMSFSKNEIFR